MLKREALESAIISAAKLQGHELNGQDKLLIRTSVAACLDAKKRHRQRMNTDAFECEKTGQTQTLNHQKSTDIIRCFFYYFSRCCILAAFLRYSCFRIISGLCDNPYINRCINIY